MSLEDMAVSHHETLCTILQIHILYHPVCKIHNIYMLILVVILHSYSIIYSIYVEAAPAF